MLNTIRRWINQQETKSFLKKNFSNAAELTECWSHGLHCDKAVFKDGSVLSHPPNSPGFIGMILEVMCQQVYTGDFFCHAMGISLSTPAQMLGFFLFTHIPCAQRLGLSPMSRFQ
jgi:hypothetical protein